MDREDHISLTDQMPTNTPRADCFLSVWSEPFIKEALALLLPFYKSQNRNTERVSY